MKEVSTEDIPSGLIMPAEWERHRACLILYPHNPKTYRLELAQKEVLQVAQAIATQGEEPVFLLAKDEAQAKEVRQVVKNNDRIHVHICPSNDTWVRDTGPTCCWRDDSKTTKELIGLDWDFNAYGGPEEGCYWPCDLDTKIATRICSKEILNIPCCGVPIILEGGSIHTDGEGTLLVTKECLLHPNRNPHLSQDEIESILKKTLGVITVLWLPHGLDADEDTNGHVDNFCCFAKPGHVVLAWTDDREGDPENYLRCREADSLLSSTADAKGRSIQVHKLHLPPPLVCF
jgi:agmatine deiminase